MNKKLELVPFSEFWTYCTLNDFLSILTPTHPEYRNHVLINSYHYAMEFKGSKRDVQLEWDKSYHEQIQSLFELKTITLDSSNYINQLIELINQNRIIYVLIDPYNWLENRFSYHIQHSQHYQMLTGYDQEQELFYFYSDTNTGYGENAVSYEKLREAIILSANQPVFQEIILSGKIPSYNFNTEKIAINAERLLKNLTNLSYMTHWAENYSDIAHPYYTIGKIADRQIVNVKLMEYLGASNLISMQISDKLAKEAQQLHSYWNFIKTMFQMSHIRHREPDINKINSIIGTCFELEYTFWEYYITNI